MQGREKLAKSDSDSRSLLNVLKAVPVLKVETCKYIGKIVSEFVALDLLLLRYWEEIISIYSKIYKWLQGWFIQRRSKQNLINNNNEV